MPEHFAEGAKPDGILHLEIDRAMAAMNVVFRRGPFAVADAAEACRNGEATPEQQKTIIEILDARYGL